jgi:hypothetical protein
LRALLDQDDPTSPPAVLWVVDGKGASPLADGFAALLQVPELRVYQVPLKAGRIDGSARELLAKHGLPATPQWFLLDPRTDAVLARGALLPKAPSFAQALEAAGFRDRAKELQAYLKRNPDVLEAHDQLLQVLRARGESMALGVMGIQAESPKERLERGDLSAKPPPPDIGAAKPLSAIQDLEAWSAFTQELDADFSSGRWREMDMAWLGGARRLDAASPTLQGLYLRWMPTVEEALRQDPSSDALWSLWAWMSEATGGHRLGPLLASLQPSPLTPPSQWPPETAARMLMAAAKTPGDWTALKTHYEAVWEDGSHPLLEKSVGEATFPWESDWADCLGPLVECSLHAGAPQRADALVRTAFQATHWSALPDKAAAIAARCGDKGLAARWTALGSTR